MSATSAQHRGPEPNPLVPETSLSSWGPAEQGTGARIKKELSWRSFPYLGLKNRTKKGTISKC